MLNNKKFLTALIALVCVAAISVLDALGLHVPNVLELVAAAALGGHLVIPDESTIVHDLKSFFSSLTASTAATAATKAPAAVIAPLGAQSSPAAATAPPTTPAA